MIFYKLKIEENGVFIDYTDKVNLPILVVERLDTGFDSAEVIVKGISRSQAYTPLTRVKITVGTKVFRFYVENPQASKTVNGAELYTHTFMLIEATKYLERIFADTLTTTQTLKGIYVGRYELVEPTITYNVDPPSWDVLNLFGFLTPLFVGDVLTIPNTKDDFLSITWGAFTVFPTAVISIDSNLGSLSLGEKITATTDLNKITVVLRYESAAFPNPVVIATLVYDFEVKARIPELPSKTISGELERICEVSEIRREGIETQKFVIDADILTKYASIRCPEFSMPRQTLWEMLLQIGDYIHGIPRLTSDESENWNVITFDFLGSQEEAENGGELAYLQNSNTLESYSTDFVSHLSNVTNTDNDEEGSIIEPGLNTYKTVRTAESGTEVTDDNGLFETKHPIAELKKVTVLYGGAVYDITKYCYESFEYEVLSSYIPVYPYSKAYALLYTLGQKNITKLQHKNESFIGTAFEDWAIVNILQKEGATISTSVGTVLDLKYNIEYVPIIDFEARQKKPNYHEYDTKSTIVYNQSANGLNSSAFGENSKGAIAMYGNLEELETYFTDDILSVPKIGTVVGDKYIAQINYEFYQDMIKYTIEYSYNFNRLSRFVGVNSNVRMYEVSERQIYDRDLFYSSVVTVGNLNAEYQDNRTMVLTGGKLALMQTFSADAGFTLNSDPNFAKVTTYRENGEILKEVALPLVTVGMGNSLVFVFKFDDNYSAGEKVIRGEVLNKLIQDYVPYTDEYGEVYKMKVSFCRAYGITGSDYEEVGDLFPEISTSLLFDEKIGTGVYPFIIQKDNRENIKMSYQIDFVTNRNDIIMGFGFTNANRLVREDITQPIKVYAMPRKIGKFEKTVDLTGATLIKTFGTLATDFDIPDPATLPYFAINPIETSVDCESLAFVNENGDLVMAYNKPLTALESSEKIYFNFK